MNKLKEKFRKMSNKFTEIDNRVSPIIENFISSGALVLLYRITVKIILVVLLFIWSIQKILGQATWINSDVILYLTISNLCFSLIDVIPSKIRIIKEFISISATLLLIFAVCGNADNALSIGDNSVYTLISLSLLFISSLINEIPKFKSKLTR